MDVSRLPALNACLNGSAALLLLAGWLFIRRKNVAAHKACMLAAFACSTLFLAGYLYYHWRAGVIYFRGTGLIRTAYLSILATHTILAASIVPLVLRTLYLALAGRFDKHRWWGRRALPLWAYVSVTGVVIYEMLFRLF